MSEHFVAKDKTETVRSIATTCIVGRRSKLKMSIATIIAYFIIGSPKEGYLSRVGKVKPTLLTFPPISHPPSGPRGAIWWSKLCRGGGRNHPSL
jgi:hypothetical protein